MKKTLAVNCVNTGSTKLIPNGTPLNKVIEEFGVKMKNPILGALVNNVMEELTFEVFHPISVQFIDITHPDGMRMYVRGLSFVLYKAVHELFPDAQLRIDHSISKGIYCKITAPNYDLTEQDVAAIKQRMQEIVESDLPFIRIEEETEEVIRKFELHGLTDKISLMKHRGRNFSSYYKLDGHINAFYGYLVPSSGMLKVFDLNKYFNGLLLQVPQANNPKKVEPLVIQNKLFEIFPGVFTMD
jgi:uridine kinase